MSLTVISVENLSKSYQLGVIGTGTFRGDLQRWWARARGLPDPFAKVGETNHGNRQGETIWALKDISFTVEQGDTLGIIGRNGAGKSTLLKILSQVTAPTSGVVKVKGRIASLLEVGTGFHPELTGRENIYLNGAIMGMNRPEVRKKFDEIIAFSGVEKYIDTPVKRYSSGMYVRLAFAVAAHLEPEILIVDEVLAVGDAEFQKKCLGKMSDVAHEGRTVLFVSHNMAAVENLCSRGIVLEKGCVTFAGRQIEAIEYYVANIDNATGVPLAERTDRTGSGEIRFTGIEIKDLSGASVNAISSGKGLEVHLHYESRLAEVNSRNLNVGFTVFSSLSTPVFSQTTRVSPVADRLLPAQGVYKCRIEELPLPASTYSINLVMKYKDSTMDAITNASNLHVVEGDFFDSGKSMSPLFGTILLKGAWDVLENE
jgi:lipopolysaccharide transport system ATP-binding protein